MKQQYFANTKPQKVFGGSLHKNKRKTQRPLSTSKVHHLVLKAENLQFRFPGVSLTKAKNKIDKSIHHFAAKYNIKILSNSVNYNHTHSAIRFTNRQDYMRFIRAVTADVVRVLSQHFSIDLKGLFNVLPYTKIVEYGRQLNSLLNYIQINIFESEGVDIIGRLANKKNTRIKTPG